MFVVGVRDALERVGSAFVGIMRWDRWEGGRTVVENPGLIADFDCGGARKMCIRAGDESLDSSRFILPYYG